MYPMTVSVSTGFVCGTRQVNLGPGRTVASRLPLPRRADRHVGRDDPRGTRLGRRRRGRHLTMAGLARPTLRCLREDLALAVPRADTPLEEISHPLLAKTTERFADDQTPHERIAAIDDEGAVQGQSPALARRYLGRCRLRAVVHDLVRQSLLDGHEHAAMIDGAALGVQVLAEQGHETYVAIRIIGSVPRRLVATVLSLIPGCELDAWMSDYAMPERAVAPEERRRVRPRFM
jgi:hypothetical protein